MLESTRNSSGENTTQKLQAPDGGLLSIIPELAIALQRGEVVDIQMPGGELPLEDVAITNTLSVQIDPRQPSISLSSLSYGCKYILIRNVLQRVMDYRSLVRVAFERLAVDGMMVITVPHQFLAERKYRAPSRYGSNAYRFYTPAGLMREVEEALDPTEHRIEILRDDDANYNYKLPIGERPIGNQRIILGVRKITRPAWADLMALDDDGQDKQPVAPNILKTNHKKSITYILNPDKTDIATIIVLKLDHRGDYLMAAAAFNRLRSCFPRAFITLVCGSWNVGAAKDSKIFDEVIALDFFPEDASTKREPDRKEITKKFFEQIDNRHFDLAIDLRYYDDTRYLIELIPAKHKAGFDRWNAFPWLDIKTGLPSPTLEGRAEQFTWGAELFKCPPDARGSGLIACRKSFALRHGDAALWGPYRELDPGKYTAHLQLGLISKGRIFVDIVCQDARTTLYRGALDVGKDGSVQIAFELSELSNDVELRVFRPGIFTSAFVFHGVRFEKSGDIIGMHQSEGMQLLIELLSIRLRQPYQIEQEVELS